MKTRASILGNYLTSRNQILTESDGCSGAYNALYRPHGTGQAPTMQKKPISKARLKKALVRTVASSTAIETGRSIVAIERKLLKKPVKAPAIRQAG